MPFICKCQKINKVNNKTFKFKLYIYIHIYSVSMEFSCCGFKSHSGQLSVATSKNPSVVNIIYT